jgi:hypothetical protein
MERAYGAVEARASAAHGNELCALDAARVTTFEIPRHLIAAQAGTRTTWVCRYSKHASAAPFMLFAVPMRSRPTLLLLAFFVGLACCTAHLASSTSPEPNAPCDTRGGVVPLVDNGLYAYAIAVDDTSVYIASGGGVWRVAKTGGTPSLVGASDYATAIAVDSRNVYWIGDHAVGGGPKPQSGNALYVAPVGGGPASILADGAYSTLLAVDDANVYGESGAGLWAVATGGGALRQLVDPASLLFAEAIALGDDGVYVASFCCDVAHGLIARVPKGGGVPVVLADNQPHPRAIAVDATAIYWSNDGYGIGADRIPGGLLRAARDGSHVTTLVTDDVSHRRGISALAVDGSNVYWSETAAGRVVKMPKLGGAETVIAEGLIAPTGLVARGGNVYWVSHPTIDAGAAPSDSGSTDATVSPSGGGSPAATVMTSCKQ